MFITMTLINSSNILLTNVNNDMIKENKQIEQIHFYQSNPSWSNFGCHSFSLAKQMAFQLSKYVIFSVELLRRSRAAKHRPTNDLR